MATLSTTIPGRTASRNWKRIAKEIAISGDWMLPVRHRLGLMRGYNPYFYNRGGPWRCSMLVVDWPLEEQYMLALFIAQFVLTDGVLE